METIIRVVVIYLFLLVGMRLIGKREFGQLSPHEFVILLIIPEMVSSALNQEDRSMTNALIGTATILVLVFGTSILTHRFPVMEKVISDSATVLAYNGRLFPDILNRERVTPQEVLDEATKSGLESIDQIRWAILQPDGKIAIVPVENAEVTNPAKETAAAKA